MLFIYNVLWIINILCIHVKKENDDNKIDDQTADEKTAPANDVRMCIFMCIINDIYVLCILCMY